MRPYGDRADEDVADEVEFPIHRAYGRPMDLNDFYWCSRQITEQLAPRISPEYRTVVLDYYGAAGEWPMAIATLVGTMSKEDVVITTAEKDTLRELMEFCRKPLTRLEQIRTSD